jgi:chromatin remodeling complex protein RSC6
MTAQDAAPTNASTSAAKVDQNNEKKDVVKPAETKKNAGGKAATKKTSAKGKAATTANEKPAPKTKASKAKVVEPDTTTDFTNEATIDTDGSVAGKKKKAIAEVDPEFDRRLKDVLTGFEEVLARVRESKQHLVDIKKAYHQQIKEINKRKKIKRAVTGNGNSGFKIPSLVRGTKLHDFMGVPHGERIARQAATQAVDKYVKEHNLHHEGNHQLFKPDAKLESIIGNTAERRAIQEERKKIHPEMTITDDVGYFNLQTFFKPLFVTKAEEAKLNTAATSSATVSAA